MRPMRDYSRRGAKDAWCQLARSRNLLRRRLGFSFAVEAAPWALGFFKDSIMRYTPVAPHGSSALGLILDAR